ASPGTLGGILGLLQSWNRTAVERGFISSALTGPEIVQLLIATASDIDPSDYTSVPNAWPTQVGWDIQTGYGRINARRFQEELRLGHIRPVAWFDGPEWFTLYDPTRQSKVEIFGHTEGRRSPGGSYGWTLEWALGAGPADAAFTTLASGTRQAAFDGKLGQLDLSQVPRADVAGIGRLQIVFGDTDGYVHAVDPSTGAEVPGFPVTTDPTVVMKSGGWPGVNPGFEPVPISVAVGDLDHDGNLWIVAATSTG